jgi:hypothetical protein
MKLLAARSRRLSFALLILICGTASISYVLQRQDRRMVYQGKTLKYWLQVLGSTSDKEEQRIAEAAVQEIGTNCLPYLMAKVDMKAGVRSFVSGGTTVRNGALGAIFILRKEAAPIVPDLVRLVERGHYPMDAALALSWCGTNGTDALIRLAQSKISTARSAAVAMLGSAQDQMEIVVPVLIKSLKDKEPGVRTQALYSIARLGTASDRVIEALQFTSSADSDPAVRAKGYQVMTNLLRTTTHSSSNRKTDTELEMK